MKICLIFNQDTSYAPSNFLKNVGTVPYWYPKEFLKERMKNAPAGAQLLLTTKHKGVYLCALGYKYNIWKSHMPYF